MQDKSGKASPVNTKNGFVRNTLQTSTRKIYRNRKKPERKTQREGPKKTRFFRPDLPIRPITGFSRKNSGVEKSRNLPRPPPLSEKRHRPTPSEHRKMTLHLAGGIFFAIFVSVKLPCRQCPDKTNVVPIRARSVRIETTVHSGSGKRSVLYGIFPANILIKFTRPAPFRRTRICPGSQTVPIS